MLQQAAGDAGRVGRQAGQRLPGPRPDLGDGRLGHRQRPCQRVVCPWDGADTPPSAGRREPRRVGVALEGPERHRIDLRKVSVDGHSAVQRQRAGRPEGGVLQEQHEVDVAAAGDEPPLQR